MSEPLRTVLCAALGFLSGGVMWSWLLPARRRGVDIRTLGADGNPGAFNAAAACGVPAGILLALLDILKAALPAAFAWRIAGLTGWSLALAALAPVFGHIFPWTLGWKGGKAITAAFGTLIGLLPRVLIAPIWAACILVLLPFIRDHSALMRVSVTLTAGIVCILEPAWPVRMLMLGIAALILWRHWEPLHARDGERSMQND